MFKLYKKILMMCVVAVYTIATTTLLYATPENEGEYQGWYQEGINIYFYNHEGKLVTGKVYIDGELYLFDELGRYIGPYNYEEEFRDFIERNPSFIVTNDGISDVFYAKSYDGNDKVIYRNFWFESDTNGIKDWYATDIEGHLLTGFVRFDNEMYYMSKRKKDIGKMQKNVTIEINDVDYEFDEKGRLKNYIGILDEPYYDMAEGRMK